MPRQRQQAAQNTGFNSAACAVELHEPARVDEPVHDSRRHFVVAEHGHPLAELYVGRGGRAYCRGHRLYRLGRDQAVFTTQIDMRDNTIVLGGVEVDEPEGIPFISRLAILGEIDTSDVADPAAP